MSPTAATNSLHKVDIAKVHEWLGQADISSTRLYDWWWRSKPGESPIFAIKY